MTAKLLSDLKLDIARLELVPGRGGCYEIWVDDERIYSKLGTGEFPKEDTIVKEVRRRVQTS